MTYTFKPGEAVLFHEPDFLTTIATFIELDEGWPVIRFADHTDVTPSQTVCRPSRVLPIDEEAAAMVGRECKKAIARGDYLRTELLTQVFEEVKAIADLKHRA